MNRVIFQTDYWIYLQSFFEWVGQSAGVMVFISGFIALTWLGYERKRRGSFTKRKLEEGEKVDISKFLRVLSYLGLAVGIMDIWAGAWGLILDIPPSFRYLGTGANHFTCIFLIILGIGMFFKPIKDLPLSSILALIAGSASVFILASLIPPGIEENIAYWINPKLLLFIVFIIVTALVAITAKFFIGIFQWISKILSWPPIAFIIMVFCFAQGIALWGFGVSIPNLL